MSLSHSPSVVTNGLVLYTDMSNTQKSWKGAPATNLYPLDSFINWPSQTTHFWNGNNWVVDATYTDPGAPGPAGVYIGKVRKYTSGALSATWSGNSYAYVLKTAPMTSGQSYAMSAYTYMSPDCNIDGLDSSIESASAAALSGGYITSYDTLKKGSWQRQGLTGTAAGNVNYILAYARKYGVTTGAFTGFFMVGGAMVETGVFPTPYTDSTRSNTQAIVDLTGNNTITATSLTYASDNTFSFNGSSSLAFANPLSTQSNATQEWSVISWVNINTTANQLLLTGINNGLYLTTGSNTTLLYLNSGANDYYTYGTAVGGAGWCQVAYRFKNSTGARTIYKNGVNISTSGPNNTSTPAGNSGTLILGSGTNGSIGATMIYNRYITDAELMQNFNALRGRYGI